MTNQEEQIDKKIQEILARQGHIIIGIDGRCGAGKSTYAGRLQEKTGGILIHMDDFFLRPVQRTKERYAEPGENIDHERFLEEVLLPLHKGEAFAYRPFDCSTMQLKEEISVPVSSVVIIEGSYAMHPSLRKYYDLTIFLNITPALQHERLKQRDLSSLSDFIEKWIPLEEKYFAKYDVEHACDFVVDTH
jgi:uridine kinase